MSYHRVIPRDFFNESKLLKCLGKFEIAVIDGKCGGLPIKTDLGDGPFAIQQNTSDGSLYVFNYNVWLGDEPMWLSIPYNNKEEWPLIAQYRNETYFVFNEKGEWLPNFGYKEKKP